MIHQSISASVVTSTLTQHNFIKPVKGQFHQFDAYFEMVAYEVIPDLKKAKWEFVELSNGGRFIYPNIEVITMFERRVSCRSAGIAIMLHCLKRFEAVASYCNESVDKERFALYRACLRAYTQQLIERDSILDIYSELQMMYTKQPY